MMRGLLLDAGDLPHVPVQLDYAVAVDPLTLRDKPATVGGTLLAVAMRVGTTRLIDNVLCP